MATERNLISIPNHPNLKDVIRKVAIVKHQRYCKFKDADDTENKIILDLFVMHFDENGKPQNKLNGFVYLFSDKNDYVNPLTGEKVEKDEEGNYPEGSVIEFDYLWDLVYTKKLLTDLQLEEMYVLKRVDKINEKLYK